MLLASLIINLFSLDMVQIYQRLRKFFNEFCNVEKHEHIALN